MTDIEPKEVFRQKAIDLINEYRQQRGFGPIDYLVIDTPEVSAFIRSIQLHEKTKQELADCKQGLADFKQKVSDAVVGVKHCATFMGYPAVRMDDVRAHLGQFIIPKPKPKPDPLVAALEGVTFDHYPPNDAKTIRAALEARGFEIREKNDV